MVDQSLNRHRRPASNPVDDVLLVYEDGGDLVQTASGAWAAKDRNGVIVVRDAESMGEAASQYIESLGLTAKPTPPTLEEILAGIKAEYAPYDAMPEFQEGFDAWSGLRFGLSRNPHDADSVSAQAWNRGVDAAARCARAIDDALRGAEVELARRPSSSGGPDAPGRN